MSCLFVKTRSGVVAQALFDQYEASAEATARVKALEGAAKALLGDDFLIIPEFNLGAARGNEFEKALGASQSGALFNYLENNLQMDFAVDTWLYGVARVREKLRAWEQIVMLIRKCRAGTDPDATAFSAQQSLARSRISTRSEARHGSVALHGALRRCVSESLAAVRTAD
jgi:hypothetical protein